MRRAEQAYNEREALDIIRAGRKKYPENFTLMCAEVEQLTDLDMDDKAEAVALEGISRFPDAARIHKLLGGIYQQREDDKSALEVFEKAYALCNKGEQREKFEIGGCILRCHVNLHNYDAALDTAEQLLAINKRLPPWTLDMLAAMLKRPAPDDIIDRAKHFLMVNFPEFLLSVVDPGRDAGYDEDDTDEDRDEEGWDGEGLEDVDWDDEDDWDGEDEDRDDEDLDDEELIRGIAPGIEIRRDGIYIDCVRCDKLPPEKRTAIIDEQRKILQNAFVSGNPQDILSAGTIISTLDPTDWDATEAVVEFFTGNGVLDAAAIALCNHILGTFQKDEEFTEHCAIIAGELMNLQYLMYAREKTNPDAAGQLIVPPGSGRVSGARDVRDWKVIRDYFENHWIDELFPVIGKHTPREMSKIEEGREILNRCIDCFIDTLREDETTLVLWEPAKLKKQLGIG